MSRPRIAVFSGSNATIQNRPTLVTSEQARRAHGLPPAAAAREAGFRFDALRPQRLAAPVTVYIEQFSAHPLERDAAELYGPPDGYVDGSGAFHEAPSGAGDIPVYRAELRPEDGLYPLPYMARRASGAPWEAADIEEPSAPEQTRQTFLPDASRLYEEIDRLGLDAAGVGNQLSRQADFDFLRPVPSAGYAHASDPVQRERWGEDFFGYSPHHLRAEAPGPWLARAANAVQEALGSGDYVGAQWLDGTPSVDEVVYWLGLIVDTEVPIVGHGSTTLGGESGFDGAINVIAGVSYLVSGCCRDAEGRDDVGPLLAVDGTGLSARDVTKFANRPGGFGVSGGRSGMVVDLASSPRVSYRPAAAHTWRSAMRTSQLPLCVPALSPGGTNRDEIAVLDDNRKLVGSSIPAVALFTYVRYRVPGQLVADLACWLERTLAEGGLVGLVYEGITPDGTPARDVETVLARAALSGVPVVVTGRGVPAGPARGDGATLIGAGTLAGPKARLLLLAALLKLGSPPVAADPQAPAPAELHATAEAVRAFQTLFDTH